MSAQLLHTCAVASQSILHPRTYFPENTILRNYGLYSHSWARVGTPGASPSGTMTVSTTATAPQGEAWLPEHSPGLSPSRQGGGKEGEGVLSQLVQSLPGVPGNINSYNAPL